MAPAAQKRQWKNEAGERRPKKKVKRVKKQDDYYSSSEDEADGATQRASDAPKNMPKRVAKVVETEPTGGNSLPLGERVPGKNTTSRREKKSVPRPKPILKKAAPVQISKATAPQAASDSEEDEGDEEDEEDDAGVAVGDLETNTALNMNVDENSADDLEDEDDEPMLDDAASSAEDSEAGDSESEGSVATSQASSTNPRNKKKRNDPDAFATSITKILSTKLSTAKRQDPVLSRSKSALEANKALADSKLEAKARAQIRSEKRAALEKGRVKDVLGLETVEVDTGAVLEEEKRLKKIAQRGVVFMFNAVRKAQISAEEERRKLQGEGVVGMKKREERVNEMSKQGFLDLISSGGKQQQKEVGAMEEA
ncbi:hypothetical protein CBER1_09524 [Cercospora berteroae]|uniref:Ribosomal RNA-processing protein 15 n=1 Tax=Cercospora berteroae TaxID=357750 RepID=A0A2S6CJ47_9PEZI|nr:hypothetical protein CBER1_09524 [Cercospora berteroae]